MNLGKKISNLRKQKNLSQEQLAEKVNVTRQTISKWELNETIPDIKSAKLLAKIFDISIDELVNEIIEIKIDSAENKTNKLYKIVIYGFIIFLIGFVIELTYLLSYRQGYNKKENEIKGINNISLICELDNQEYGIIFTIDETNNVIQKGGSSYIMEIIKDNKTNPSVIKLITDINNHFINLNGTCR